jgi:glycosyltransferase involved in cell wall biosynthesis
MNVGLIAEGLGMQSLKYVFEGIEQSLSKRHRVIHRPMEFFYSSPRRQEELHEEFLLNSDVIIGRIDEGVLRSRERLDRQPPLIGFLLGAISRGGGELSRLYRYLKSTDVLVGNCTGDVEITSKFFKNVQARNLPFAFDESTFQPVDEAQRQALKAELGFQPTDKILLYAGRLTMEKNLHTQLRIFSVLQKVVPELHLVVVGQLENVPFTEFGVYCVDIAGTITRLITDLRLDTERIHFLGRKSPAQLRDFFIIADALVNLTLHHDENFGYAQVEAMACGTPVIGSCWGGLRDTIKHAETGYHISTVVTDAGVKLNWWEAINRIVQLVQNDDTVQRFRERCPSHVMEHFSKQRYDEILESILADCMKRNEEGSEPLVLSEFGDEFWHQCQNRAMSPPPYRRGKRSFELYKELITPFTGVTENMVPAAENFKPDHLLVLAIPVQVQARTIRINDPIFPQELIVPVDYQKTCHAVLEILRKEPVMQFERLRNLVDGSLLSCLESTLKWMLEAGVLLRTKTTSPAIDPRMIGEQMGKPLFLIQGVDYRSDVIVIKQMG